MTNADAAMRSGCSRLIPGYPDSGELGTDGDPGAGLCHGCGWVVERVDGRDGRTERPTKGQKGCTMQCRLTTGERRAGGPGGHDWSGLAMMHCWSSLFGVESSLMDGGAVGDVRQDRGVLVQAKWPVTDPGALKLSTGPPTQRMRRKRRDLTLWVGCDISRSTYLP